MDVISPVCIITGGTGGIGLPLSAGFHTAGYRVAALDVELRAPLPEGVDFHAVDLRHDADVAAVFRSIGARHGPAHVLINNAAIAHFHKPVQDISMEEFDAVLGVNLRGSFLCCKEFLALNAGQPYGRIINIASTRWGQNEAHWDAYGASKGGLVALTQSLAVSLGDVPVTVNAVSPGWIETGDYTALRPEDHAQHPSGRVGRPQDIVNACLFLAQAGNDFINGHNLVVDGGMSKKMQYV